MSNIKKLKTTAIKITKKQQKQCNLTAKIDPVQDNIS
jgi:hypothetical protein